jgi:hypothetical protein
MSYAAEALASATIIGDRIMFTARPPAFAVRTGRR